jgi:hypothetical protein
LGVKDILKLGETLDIFGKVGNGHFLIGVPAGLVGCVIVEFDL